MKSVCVSAAFLLFILVEAGPLDEHGGLKHGALGKNPTEHDLKAFLATKPNLWKPQPASHDKKHKPALGAARPTAEDKKEIAKEVAQDEQLHGNQTAKMKLHVRLPREFDARKHWPHCESIRTIQSQMECGSCWAVATASAASDRACIASDGEFQPQLSAANLMGCCPDCHMFENRKRRLRNSSNGCKGGYPFKAWRYFKYRGIVTGGSFGSKIGCKPYHIAPNSTLQENEANSLRCSTKCDDGQDYYSSKFYGDRVRYPLNAHTIQLDLYLYGPLILTFDYYEDLSDYKSGVYYHQYGKQDGAHAVKLIGWGVENDIPYWLIANSWGEYWGDKGTFKIIRGINHLNIEADAVAGTFDYSRTVGY